MPKPSMFPFTYLYEILNSPRVRPLAQRLHPSIVVDTLKGVFDDAVGELRASISEQRLPDVSDLLDRLVARLNALLTDSEPLVLDARGRLIASDVERLADSALEESVWVAAEPQSDYSRRRDVEREKSARAKLAKLSGAEAVAVFPNVELARIAVLQALDLSGKGLVIARRDMCERDDGTRLENVLKLFPRLLRREVGASNAADLKDFDEAITSEIGLVWRVISRWTAGGRIVGDADLARLKSAPGKSFQTVADVEFAPLIDLSEYFYSTTPSVSDRLKDGWDYVICDGAQLIGGPNCGLVFCSRASYDRVVQTQVARLIQPDRVLFGALVKTLALYDSPDVALAQIPVLRALSTSVANLESRAKRLAQILETFNCVQIARVVEGQSALCSGASPVASPTRLVELRPRGYSPAELAAKLEHESPKLLVRWTRDVVLIDMRTLTPEQDVVVSEIFERVEAKPEE